MRRANRFFAPIAGSILAAGLAAPALGQQEFPEDAEISIELYLQPDDTGENTLNKSVELEIDELTIEESRPEGENRYVERAPTAEETRRLMQLVYERTRGFELTADEGVDAPKVEVQIEFDGGSRSFEVEEEYPVGEVPQIYLDLQAMFFEDSFE